MANDVAYQYTPYTSEFLDSGMATINDVSGFTGVSEILPAFPSGKQVIFFSLGLVCVIGSLALLSRGLIADSVPGIAALAKLAV